MKSSVMAAMFHGDMEIIFRFKREVSKTNSYHLRENYRDPLEFRT